MPNPNQFELLKQGVAQWNQWREANREQFDLDLRQGKLFGNTWVAVYRREKVDRPDLRDADLTGMDLSGANLKNVDLGGANLTRANLKETQLTEANLVSADLTASCLTDCALTDADLTGARITRADLRGADLAFAKMKGADLSDADLRGANVSRSDLRDADLSRANLSAGHFVAANFTRANLNYAVCTAANFAHAQFVWTNLENADLTGACIYGISVWDVRLTGAVQRDLIITHKNAPSQITVDDIEVAQFVYLLLNNDRLRKVIDTITSKAVLILGRFTPERKAVLDALREEVRGLGYVPMLFDFEPAVSQSRMQTVSTLAHMVRFVIADITDAKSVLQELQGIVPDSPTLPVQPIMLAGQKEPGMFDFFRLYPWFLPTVYYDSLDSLLPALRGTVIRRAEEMAKELERRLDEIRKNG